MTVTVADPLAGLAGYLKTTEAGTIAGGRVFRPSLPDAEIGQMPRACIVIRRAGGYAMFGASNPPVGDPLLDLFCYGQTELEAENLSGAVVAALRALRTSTYRGSRLYWARIAGGPNPFVDPETLWPCTVVTAQVAHCETEIT